jgi:hypothetical protein
VSCISRPRISSKLWLANVPIPQEICQRESALNDYGYYRKLSDNRIEFVSFCEQKSNQFVSITKADLARLLGEQNEGKSKARQATDALSP